MRVFRTIYFIFSTVCLNVIHYLVPQRLTRTPEPQGISDQSGQVTDYDQVMDTSLTVSYALLLDKIQDLVGDSADMKYLDLCCGPGHFSKLVIEHFPVKEAHLVDLSGGMLEVASKNLGSSPSKVVTLKDDVRTLSKLPDANYSLITLTNGLHHFSSLEDVRMTLNRIDQLLVKDGVLVIVDPVRSKTDWLANWYTRLLGQDNIEKGRVYFQKDFEYSVAASWTHDELFSCLASGERRHWYHLQQLGFPTFQFVVASNTEISKGNLLPIKSIGFGILPPRFRSDYLMLKLLFRLGRIRSS